MSLGLSKALVAIIDLMNREFQNYLDSFVIVFIDDIFVYLKDEDDHMGHLSVVLQTLKEHQLYAKYSKCEFLLRSVSFVGHIISSEGVKLDPRKMEEVKNLPRPLNLTDFRSFLGLAGYFCSGVDLAGGYNGFCGVL